MQRVACGILFALAIAAAIFGLVAWMMFVAPASFQVDFNNESAAGATANALQSLERAAGAIIAFIWFIGAMIAIVAIQLSRIGNLLEKRSSMP